MKNKNRKTVRKGFTYLQCDDFAAYLSDMASKGWHFKEWGTGLVFEKGEPEQAVYAVEVFIHGSDYDLKPDEHTLNFSDYCETAGWKLIDSKQKYCIFKQIHPDAVPIVTREERLNNASTAYRGQLIWQVVISIMWIGNMLLRFLPKPQLIDSLLSDFHLITAAFWVYYCFCTLARCIWYLVWLHKAKKRIAAGEYTILNQAKETFWNWISNFALIVLLIGQIAAGGPIQLIISLAAILVILIPSLLFAKFRPDRETFIGFQIVLPIILIFTIIIGVLFSLTISESKQPSDDEFPLVYEDLGYDAGKMEDVSHSSSSSIFGSKCYYSLRYEKAALSYMQYETKHDWLLDLIWEYEMSRKWNANVTDCTALWNADLAYQNTAGGYAVRIDDTILILNIYDDAELSIDQVAIILEVLGLEG